MGATDEIYDMIYYCDLPFQIGIVSTEQVSPMYRASELNFVPIEIDEKGVNRGITS
jgi:hypothetical protein